MAYGISPEGRVLYLPVHLLHLGQAGRGKPTALLQELAGDLLAGKTLDPDSLRDNLLHTIACKSAIKAGWQTSDEELRRLVQEVLSRDDIKYCPHGRPVCVTLTKRQLEKQFKRT